MPSTAVTSPTETGDLRLIWRTFHSVNPQVRIRDAAAQLGVSEAELLATSCGENVVRLDAEWDQLVHRLAEMGPVMALTRNEHAVSEKQGTFRNIKFHGQTGIVRDEGGIDLRLFMRNWHMGFAVEIKGRQGKLRSFQFFDRRGTAVHKVYLTDRSNESAYERLASELASANQEPHQHVEIAEPSVQDRPDYKIDVSCLQEAWNGLKDTHDFRNLLERFGVGRVQALRLVNDDLACRVNNSALSDILHMAAQYHISIMIFVGNPGVMQIHSGPVHTIKSTDYWVNVLDDGFNLHIREDQIRSAWVVRKPTEDGLVSSLELYDEKGETIALIFAKRKEGESAPEAWHSMLCSLLPARRLRR